MCDFPPEVGVTSCIRRVVCCYKCDLRVVLVGGWYIGEFFNGEPLPVAPSQSAGACRGERK